MSKVQSKFVGIAEPASYKIEVQGKLDPNWADLYGSLRVEHRLARDGVAVTTLIGKVPDQAALAGLLNLTYTLGMPLLSVVLLDGCAIPAVPVVLK